MSIIRRPKFRYRSGLLLLATVLIAGTIQSQNSTRPITPTVQNKLPRAAQTTPTAQNNKAPGKAQPNPNKQPSTGQNRPNKQPGTGQTGTQKALSMNPTRQEMKQAIIAKKMFTPGINPPLFIREEQADTTTRPLGPRPLERDFTFIAFDRVNNEPRAYLLLENPPETRMVREGDIVEDTITILKITPTFIRCTYANHMVRIDLGETSKDALERLNGFAGKSYNLVGINIQDDIAFAYILFEGEKKPRRFEVGEWLGTQRIVDIQPNQVTLESKNGEKINILPTPQTKPKGT